MPRIACLWVPDLYVRAHLRLEPELAGRPLILTDGRAGRSTVIAASDSAMKAGVFPAMSVAQARVVCDALVVRPVSSEALAAAIATLGDVASTVSARVEDERDLVFLDCAGSRLLWASESELAAVLAARAAYCGLPAWVGISDSKLCASVAARSGGGVQVVPPGTTREFLQHRPLALLQPDSASAATLASWGLRVIGDLAALPSGAVAHRLGPAGVALVRRARGEDDAPLVGRRTPRTFSEALGLEYEVDRLEPLLFVLRRLIECVTNRIDLHGLGCREIEVRFDLEGGGCDLRTLTAAAPTIEHKVFVTLARMQLEKFPLARPVIKVSIEGLTARISPTQLDFLRPSGPAPAALAFTLARLAVLCGPNRVGVLRRADSHRPDAVEVECFEGDSGTRRRKLTPAISSEQGTERTIAHMALRALRPPVELEVVERAGCPDYVRGNGFGGRVIHRAGPWRLRGEWWTAEPYAREYYDVELSDGGVYRIYRNLRLRRWLADGVYD